MRTIASWPTRSSKRRRPVLAGQHVIGRRRHRRVARTGVAVIGAWLCGTHARSSPAVLGGLRRPWPLYGPPAATADSMAQARSDWRSFSCGMRWRAGDWRRPERNSLRLLPSGPDRVGERSVRRQPPAGYYSSLALTPGKPRDSAAKRMPFGPRFRRCRRPVALSRCIMARYPRPSPADDPGGPPAAGARRRRRPIADVYVEAWRSTYPGMLPTSVLVHLSKGVQAQEWAQVLGRRRFADSVIVAELTAFGVIAVGSCGQAQTHRAAACRRDLHPLCHPRTSGQGRRARPAAPAVRRAHRPRPRFRADLGTGAEPWPLLLRGDGGAAGRPAGRAAMEHAVPQVAYGWDDLRLVRARRNVREE